MPLVFALPGVTTTPLRIARVASLVDIAPTMLALLGIPPPASFEGSGLLHGAEEMAFFFTDYALVWAGLRDGCWKYPCSEVEADRSQLFDVCHDAEERTSVASPRVLPCDCLSGARAHLDRRHAQLISAGLTPSPRRLR